LPMERVEEIRQMYASGEWSQNRLARHFGISQTTVWSVVNHKTYAKEKKDDV
jgi:DNA invertase Pin-like site-specific DNA recombinase